MEYFRMTVQYLVTAALNMKGRTCPEYLSIREGAGRTRVAGNRLPRGRSVSLCVYLPHSFIVPSLAIPQMGRENMDWLVPTLKLVCPGSKKVPHAENGLHARTLSFNALWGTHVLHILFTVRISWKQVDRIPLLKGSCMLILLLIVDT